MTALVALEYGDPQSTTITVSQTAATIGESSAMLQTGDSMNLETALKALMIPSGNDAAQAIAESMGDLSLIHIYQDLVKGVTTEMSGKVLGQVEIMHWCENILFLAWVAMFFVWDNPLCIPVVIVALILIYLLEIWIDNNFARVKWQLLLKSAWVVTLIFAGINIGLLIYL